MVLDRLYLRSCPVNAVEQLKVNEVSQPVDHAKGFYVIKLLGEREPRAQNLAEAQERIQVILKGQAVHQTVPRRIDVLFLRHKVVMNQKLIPRLGDSL